MLFCWPQFIYKPKMSRGGGIREGLLGIRNPKSSNYGLFKNKNWKKYYDKQILSENLIEYDWLNMSYLA